MVTINELPDELLIKVLAVVPHPYKYGYVMRSVCKKWNLLMKTSTFRRMAYGSFILSCAAVAEFAPRTWGNFFNQVIAPALFNKYTTEFTRELILAPLEGDIVSLIEKLGPGPQAISFDMCYSYGAIEKVNQCLSSKVITSRLVKVTFYTDSSIYPPKLAFCQELNLPKCEEIFVINCEVASPVLSKFLNLPSLRHLTLKYTNSCTYGHIALKLNRLLDFLNHYRSVDGPEKTIKLTLPAKTLTFSCHNGHVHGIQALIDYRNYIESMWFMVQCKIHNDRLKMPLKKFHD